MDASIEGVCRTCGNVSQGVSFSSWVKDTFTNFDQLRQGEIVCEACQFCFSESHPIVQAKTNRPTPQKMRTYSHFVVGGEWHALTKGDKRKMRELLASHPTVAVIAESGQKHLIFRARAGWWQFEEIPMLPDWERVESLLVIIEELMTEFSKAEIESDRYLQPRIVKFGFARWRELSQQLAPVRLSSFFQLAVFLAQKDESAL